VKQKYLFGVEVLSPSRQLTGYGVLEFTPGLVRLVTHRTIGSVIGGVLLMLCTWAFFGAMVVPFVIFHVPPITKWNWIFAALFAVSFMAGFLAIILLGARLLLPRVEIRYARMIREPRVIETRLSEREIVVQLDGEDFILSVSSTSKGLLPALLLAGIAVN